MRDAVKTVGNILDRQTTVFLGSVDEEGFPNLKAMMAPRNRKGIKTLYFTTNTSSLRVSQFRKNPKACVYFCDRRFYRGIQLKGQVEVLEDEKSKKMIWQTGDEKYYAGGVNDHDYCVLKFTAHSGRYYSNFKSEDFQVE